MFYAGSIFSHRAAIFATSFFSHRPVVYAASIFRHGDGAINIARPSVKYIADYNQMVQTPEKIAFVVPFSLEKHVFLLNLELLEDIKHLKICDKDLFLELTGDGIDDIISDFTEVIAENPAENIVNFVLAQLMEDNEEKNKENGIIKSSPLLQLESEQMLYSELLRESGEKFYEDKSKLIYDMVLENPEFVLACSLDLNVASAKIYELDPDFLLKAADLLELQQVTEHFDSKIERDDFFLYRINSVEDFCYSQLEKQLYFSDEGEDLLSPAVTNPVRILEAAKIELVLPLFFLMEATILKDDIEVDFLEYPIAADATDFIPLREAICYEPIIPIYEKVKERKFFFDDRFFLDRKPRYFDDGFVCEDFMRTNFEFFLNSRDPARGILTEPDFLIKKLVSYDPPKDFVIEESVIFLVEPFYDPVPVSLSTKIHFLTQIQTQYESTIKNLAILLEKIPDPPALIDLELLERENEDFAQKQVTEKEKITKKRRDILDLTPRERNYENTILEIKIKKRDHWLKIYEQFWITGKRDWTDRLLLPIDYDYGEKPYTKNGQKVPSFNLGVVHPNDFDMIIDEHPVELGADLGLREIEVSINVIVDMFNIYIMLWFSFFRQYLYWTGMQATKDMVMHIFNFITLETSREKQKDKGVIDDYNRTYRWIRWITECRLLEARHDPLLRGNHYVDLVVHDMANYLKKHHFDVAPIYEFVEIMDEYRREDDIELMFTRDKIKGIRKILIGGK